MAQGYNNDTHLSACRLLECPICLEQMQQPKSLPCLHSFCTKCLGTYIVTDLSGEMEDVTSFPCPVCRRMTSPVNHKEDKKKWAQRFPTNNHVTSLINLIKEKDTRLVCGPCKATKNEENKAQLYCKTTDMLFCEPCKITFHDVVHKGCDITNITQTPQAQLWKQVSTMVCRIHSDEKMDCFCEDHMFIGCNKCIITEHRLCDAVTTTKEYFEKQKGNSQLNDMEKFLDTASNSMELMVKAFDDQVETIQRCQDVGLDSIINLRQNIKTHLDKKQEEITQKLNSTYKTEKEKVDLSKQKFNRLNASMQDTKKALRLAVLREDYVDTIELLCRGQTETRACNDLLGDFSRSFPSVSIKHEIDEDLQTLDDSSVLSLGRVVVERAEQKLPEGVEFLKVFSKCQAKRIRTVHMAVSTFNAARRRGQVVSRSRWGVPQKSIILMPDDRIIVSDNEQENLKLFSKDGETLGHLNVGGGLQDICRVDRDTIAVAVSQVNTGIYVVKIHDSKLSSLSIIPLPRHNSSCFGIAFTAGKFAVSTPRDIYCVTKEGETNKIHSLEYDCHHMTCDIHPNQIVASFLTSVSDHAVVARLSEGSQENILNVGMVRSAMGVDVDREGNVYVCGQASNNVVQIPADGSKARELLTSADGIEMPTAISVCEDKFAVTYQSAQHKNEIHVYQLC
ncbi:uncharacterized protein LOC117341733 [Pecten maximus]|uniref:uncharacterized protein LOC117341733 n=1 Tax=Pecten maximus TaxID=6579 RepID=UPI001458CC60|nr:uncharacterized protein LOC117341733 [Pecten maximus]